MVATCSSIASCSTVPGLGGNRRRWASASPYSRAISMPAFLAMCIIVWLDDRQCIYNVSTSELRQWMAARSNSLVPMPSPRADFDTETPNSATVSLVVAARCCCLGANARWPTATSLNTLL